MIRRPLSVTIISWTFIIFSVIAVLGTVLPLFTEGGLDRFEALKLRNPFEFWAVPLLRVIAGVCGLFMLYAYNWARWLLIVWISSHVVLSMYHSQFELLVHIVIFVALSYFLFSGPAAAWFRRTNLGR